MWLADSRCEETVVAAWVNTVGLNQAIGVLKKS